MDHRINKKISEQISKQKSEGIKKWSKINWINELTNWKIVVFN
jgi:hypothetical protein